MFEKILEKIEEYAQENNLTIDELKEQAILEEEQNSFLKTNIGQAINTGIDIGLKVVLPDFIEDEIISIKDTLITEGFSAAINTAIEEATNLGKSALGILTGNFENMLQVKDAIGEGGLIDTVSDLLDKAIDWAEEKGYIQKSVATAITEGKNMVLDTVKDGVENTLETQVEAIEKIEGYINKWYQYYEEENFQNMEYQYEKIQEYIQEVMPLEDILENAGIVENLHELIKNNGKNFDLTEEEKALAQMLVD